MWAQHNGDLKYLILIFHPINHNDLFNNDELLKLGHFPFYLQILPVVKYSSLIIPLTNLSQPNTFFNDPVFV